jgi:molybdate transport system ATP-binding protein
MAIAAGPGMMLTLENISVRLASFTLEANAVFTGDAIGLVGPSGAGKTTLLEVIAGIRRPVSGRVVLDGTIWNDTAAPVFVPIQARRAGYVPQDLALFPHLSVRRNLLYGHKAEFEAQPLFRFEHVTRVLEITGLLERGVGELSGGEKQRVAIARALLSSPRLVLLDEPLTSLDARLKAQIVPYLKRVRDEFKVPLIFVSHDQADVMALCGQVWRVESGRVLRQE